MSIDLPALKQDIVEELIQNISNHEGLVRFHDDIVDAVLGISNSPKFDGWFNEALNDQHIRKVIARMIANHMYMSHIEDRLEINLSLEV